MDKKQVILLLTLMLLSIYLVKENKTDSSEFQEWKAKFSMTFSSEFENRFREKVFLERLERIRKHNSDPTRTYDKGTNQFSHLTHREFVELYLNSPIDNQIEVQIPDNTRLGDVDWTTQGAVTDVKVQGTCSSSWAFSTTGALEGLSKISTGELQSFSEQQLIDCSQHYGTYGCNGGVMDNAFKYVKDKGIVHELEYMYEGRLGACRKNGGPFKISGYVDVKSCDDLANAIQGRPVSVQVGANNWEEYKSGIWKVCSKRVLDLGVLLVGVTDQYWKVKNSWGSSWGEGGYIRLARGNTCGICTRGSYPTPS